MFCGVGIRLQIGNDCLRLGTFLYGSMDRINLLLEKENLEQRIPENFGNERLKYRWTKSAVALLPLPTAETFNKCEFLWNRTIG